MRPSAVALSRGPSCEKSYRRSSFARLSDRPCDARLVGEEMKSAFTRCCERSEFRLDEASRVLVCTRLAFIRVRV
jgi:hypothetical protein